MKKSTYEFIEKDGLAGITTYQAGVLQATVHRSLQKHSDEILKPYGITKMQWLIIGSLLDAGKSGMRITDLAKIVGTTLPYLTNTVNLLESKHMIIRANDEKDSRAKIVFIDPNFVKQCAEIEQTMRAALRQSIYAHVSPKEFRTYLKVLYQLSKVGDSRL